jgi:protein SCO1
VFVLTDGAPGDRPALRSPPMSSSVRSRQPSWFVPALIVVALLAGTLAVGIVLAGLGGAGSAATRGRPAAGLRADALPGGLAGRPAPRIRLTDGRGGVVDTRALRGRPYAVTFLYTRCPDVCPTIAVDLGEAMARAPKAAVVAVSVDPRGDTPAAVRAFAAAHRLPRGFRYGIGDRRTLQRVWRAWFVSNEVGDPRTSTHTAVVWIVDGRGRLRGMYPGGAASPADVAHDLRALS